MQEQLNVLSGDAGTRHRAAPDALDSRPKRVPAYSTAARVLHWITAGLILTMIPLGFVIANEWGGYLQGPLYDVHRSLGVALVPIVVLRLILRWVRPPLPLPEDVPVVQRRAAQVTHAALYMLLLLQPLAGWIATSAYPAPLVVFGLFELPPIWPEDRAFSEWLFSLHSVMGIAIAGLVTAHAGAAFYHHFVRKDRVLMRMIAG